MIPEIGCVILGAILLDVTLGDPRNRWHPTVWMGQLMAILVVALKSDNARLQRVHGVILVISVVIVVVLALVGLYVVYAIFADYLIWWWWLPTVLYIVSGIILLKCTIAIRGLKKHADAIIHHLEKGDINKARSNLSMIVKRDTTCLNESQIISGVLESVSENTVDGITGPLFYYALAGIPGAFVYRVVNTADSMIGYKNHLFVNLGWFAAKCDTVLNYVPSRLTSGIMVISAALLHLDWRGAYRSMIAHGHKTSSKNAGYPMATLAGSLGVRLEKKGYYILDGSSSSSSSKIPTTVEATPRREHVRSAVSIMILTSVIFSMGIVVPITIIAVSVIGRWWW